MVVIINENSASASEITAWALSDYNKAILVWKKSYGKWSVQQPFDLSNGWTLKLTIARWFTPENKNIDKEGIEPDIEVGFEKEDFENDYDRQLETAKEVLNSFIKYGSPKLSVDKYNKANNK
jgi:carboxyl-terminal processing protease